MFEILILFYTMNHRNTVITILMNCEQLNTEDDNMHNKDTKVILGD